MVAHEFIQLITGVLQAVCATVVSVTLATPTPRQDDAATLAAAVRNWLQCNGRQWSSGWAAVMLIAFA